MKYTQREREGKRKVAGRRERDTHTDIGKRERKW
jgi:hypothetical protein